MNPAYRSSSPQPSTLDSHHDPDSDLAQNIGRGSSHVSPHVSQPNSADNTPRKPIRQQAPPQESFFRSSNHSDRDFQAHPQRSDFPEVPHNEYPTDGMTQFCRINPPTTSDVSSNASPLRPASRDSQSECSVPTSFTSQDPSLGASSPTKGFNDSDLSQRSAPEAEKKKSGFFQNRSPFRRKSKSEKDRPQSFAASSNNRNTWAPASAGTARPGMPFGRHQANGRISPSPEPVDPRASFQLNIGNNVFDVASPDVQRRVPQKQATDGQDEMAKALAAVKDLTKQSSVRMSADRYAGMSTPVPGSASGSSSSVPTRSSMPDRTRHPGDRVAPPPSYTSQPQQSMSRLGAPQPAHTSRQMQQTTQRFAEQNRSLFNPSSAQSRPGTGGAAAAPGHDRTTSPIPPRAASPRPASYGSNNMNRMSQPNMTRAVSPNPHRMSQGNIPRAASPNPYLNGGGNVSASGRPRAQSTSPVKGRNADPYGAQRQSYGASPADQIPRARSPQPSFGGSQAGDSMAIQLAPASSDQGYAGQTQYPSRGSGRPMSNYGAMTQAGMPDQRTRSKSFGVGGGMGAQQVSRDGRPVIHYGE